MIETIENQLFILYNQNFVSRFYQLPKIDHNKTLFHVFSVLLPCGAIFGNWALVSHGKNIGFLEIKFYRQLLDI